MFEKIIVRRHAGNTAGIDAGLLAETMLFYEHVHVLFDRANLASLLRSIGPDTLNRLLEEKRLSGTFFSDSLATFTNTRNDLQFHNFTAFSIARDSDGTKITSEDWVRRGFTETLGQQYGMGKKAKRFIDLIKFRKQGAAEVIEIARKDVIDAHYIRPAVEIILQNAIPGISLPANWYFRAVEANAAGEFISDTNLNFAKLNEQYHRLVPPEINSLTPAWILTQILDARADMFFAADYMAEFATDDLKSQLVKLRYADLLRRRFSSAEQVESFQDLNFGDARAIREAINSGSQTFDDFLKILDKAKRFKTWLNGQNPDASLLAEYYKASLQETWAESLPTKFLHFVFSTVAAPLVGPLGEIALNFGDAMFSDRILKGWRPNQFIQGPLKKFVEK